MARPFGLSKILRGVIGNREMTFEEICKAQPRFTKRQISQALHDGSRRTAGIRFVRKYRLTAAANNKQAEK